MDADFIRIELRPPHVLHYFLSASPRSKPRHPVLPNPHAPAKSASTCCSSLATSNSTSRFLSTRYFPPPTNQPASSDSHSPPHTHQPSPTTSSHFILPPWCPCLAQKSSPTYVTSLHTAVGPPALCHHASHLVPPSQADYERNKYLLHEP